MSRVPRSVVDPRDPKSISEHLYRVQRVVDGLLEFGSPQDPTDPTSTTRADGVSHNGTVLNMDGSWFEAVLTAAGRSSVTVTHNLNVGTDNPTTSANVRWMVFGWQHNGTGGSGATRLDLAVWYQGGTRTADAIDLVFDVTVTAGALTIDALNPVVVTLFVTRAVR